MRLADADGNPVPPGTIGELICRGPFMMDGYFENEAETAAYFRTGDEWGWSGDLAVADADGFITLVGRSKEMIVSGGINIYPREIEIVMETHPAVAECTVFGVPDDRWGEALIAYVVRRPDAADTAKTRCWTTAPNSSPATSARARSCSSPAFQNPVRQNPETPAARRISGRPRAAVGGNRDSKTVIPRKRESIPPGLSRGSMSATGRNVSRMATECPSFPIETFSQPAPPPDRWTPGTSPGE